MHESVKLIEAEFFLLKLVEARDQESEYRHYLSGFLSAARSVLQYAHKECQGKLGGPAWYNAQVADNVIRFFKGERDLNTHTRPVDSAHQKAVMMGSLGAIKINPETNIVESFTPSGEMSGPFTLFIGLNGWAGPEDATELSKQYLNKLKLLVKEGRKSGFLT